MILTTGFEIQGYFITEYIDVIFDEMLVGLGLGKSILSGLDNLMSSLTGTEATEMINKLNSVKEQLRKRLIRKAADMGANALIGIDFESSRLGDLIMVSMTATAVKIDKIVSPLPRLQAEERKAEEAALQKKREEDRERRMAQIKDQNLTFDPEIFLDSIQAFESIKELLDYVKEQAKERPDIFEEGLMARLSRCTNMERIYGKGVGREDALHVLRKHLEPFINK